MQRGRRGEGLIRAHVFSFQLHHNASTEGLDVCHACDNPRCVNPDHLFLGTRKDNMQDACRKGRISRKPKAVGSSNGNSKLKEDDVVRIRELAATGASNSQLAKTYNVSKETVSRIIRGLSWKHLLS
jgi:hypothetical protein